MHKAQNTHHCDKIITDWREYIKQKMQMVSGIGHDCLANFDQTPLYYFSPESLVTLDLHGNSIVAACEEL